MREYKIEKIDFASVDYPEKLRKAVYNAVMISKGSYPYNRSLGSNIGSIDYSASNLFEQCDIAVKEALSKIPDIKYKQCVIENAGAASLELRVRFEYMGKTYETEVLHIYG